MTPKELLSDKDTQFTNEVITELCKMVGIIHTFTMRASKQEKSIVERSIKEMRRHLRKINFNTKLLDNKSTDTLLVQRVLYAYESSRCITSTLKHTQNSLVITYMIEEYNYHIFPIEKHHCMS